MLSGHSSRRLVLSTRPCKQQIGLVCSPASPKQPADCTSIGKCHCLFALVTTTSSCEAFTQELWEPKSRREHLIKNSTVHADKMPQLASCMRPCQPHHGPECPKWTYLAEAAGRTHKKDPGAESLPLRSPNPWAPSQQRNQPPPPPRPHRSASQLDCDVATCLTPSLSLCHYYLSLMTHPPLMPYQEEEADTGPHPCDPHVASDARPERPKARVPSTQPRNQHIYHSSWCFAPHHHKLPKLQTASTLSEA